MILFLLFGLPLCFAAEDADKMFLPSEELLDRSLEAFRWFNNIGDVTRKKSYPPSKYREKVTPLEFLQVIAFFQQQKDKDKTDVAKLLAAMIPYFGITPEESYGFMDQLDEKQWKSIEELDGKSVAGFREAADRFRKTMLNNAETVALLNEPKNAAEIFKVIHILRVTGRPVIVNHYLKQFLTVELTPKEAEAILTNLGPEAVIRLAQEPQFQPFGRQAIERLNETVIGTTSIPAVPAEIVLHPRAVNLANRFSKLKAKMESQPAEPYAGSSLDSESLLWFSKSKGEKLVLAVHPKLSKAKEMSSFFVKHGYKELVAATCKDALQLAAENPDVEWVVIDEITPFSQHSAGIGVRGAVAQFIALMPNDWRTADIPIAVLCDTDKREITFPAYYPRITTQKSADFIYHDFQKKIGAVPVEERVHWAKEAKQWLTEIHERQKTGKKVYHFEQ